MSTSRVRVATGMELAYETFGAPQDPAVVLVMGLGTQMLAWPDRLCEDLAGRGLHVVRFDNRDVGGSTHLDGVRAPRLVDLVTRRRRPPYTVEDMADDCAGLLDALGLRDVHLVGASLGGYIAQTVAVRHADRLASLTLFMTSTGSRRVGQPDPRLVSRLVKGRSATSREEAMDAVVETFRVIGSKGYALDEEHLRDLAGRSWDRGYDRQGYYRQLAAAVAQRDRTAQLRRLRLPTLVVHGLADPLVRPSGGLAVAEAVPGARFVGISGMGHDLPPALWGEFADLVAGNVRRALAADVAA
jgi:pimeloyl-ACP methyl ester carboxylesterase